MMIYVILSFFKYVLGSRLMSEGCPWEAKLFEQNFFKTLSYHSY